MMMLSAVVLLVGFLALAGMVSRVNQLGTQTGTESRQAVLDESVPLKRSVDNGLARLANRTFTTCCTWTATGVVTASSDIFSAADIGLTAKGGNLAAGTQIASVASARTATVTPVPAAQATAATLNLWRPGFALKATTSPTAETAATQLLEQMQLVEAGHGLWMDWQITCVGADPAKGQAIVALSDATVWIELRSTVTFPRSACTTVTG
jgi:Tfp pilus assembly protein PilV